MWTVGSKLCQGNVGAALQNRNSWKDTSVFSGNNKEIFDAELWAIADALEITRKMTLNNHNTPMKVFSDSQEALTAIRQLSFTRVVQS